jgi:outer membrane protein OmpA-like peptidoglycan-associated protein
MSGKFQVWAGCVTGLASAIMFGWAVMAQETIITPDGRCVVSYGDRQPTVEEMKHALELGENCFRTRGLRREPNPVATEGACPRGSSLALNIHFQFDSAALTEEARRQLQQVAEVMGEFPTCRFMLEGHTDAYGPDAYNLDLSNRRALAVEEHLTRLRIQAQRLVAVGLGKTRPLRPDAPYADENRRVEIMIDGNA